MLRAVPVRIVPRVLFAMSALMALASLVGTVFWAGWTLGVRPLDGVEGDVLFEADRIRSGLALYTDPAAGAYDYGAVPARYLVLYPPLWSSFLSLLPRASAPVLGRAIAALSWFGLLVWITVRADAGRRLLVGWAAAFVGGIWILGLYGASARPDGVALLVSGLALERASRRGRVDLGVGVLFALAAWIKPNVIGIAPGVFVAAALSATAGEESRAARAFRALGPALVGAFAVSAVASAILTARSGNAWISHLLLSTGQPPSASLWLSQVASRAPFFALPLAAALVLGWRSRRDPATAIAFGGLVTATAWCLLSLSKIGSAANYLMEPCVAAVVVLARADLPKLDPRNTVIVAGLTIFQVAWIDVASLRSSFESIAAAAPRRDAVIHARETCGASPETVVIADEPGLELMLDGRIVATPFQSTHLARRGRISTAPWISDVKASEVQCLVMQDDLLERPLDDVRVEHDRFGPELRQTLKNCFLHVTEASGYHVYRKAPEGCK